GDRLARADLRPRPLHLGDQCGHTGTRPRKEPGIGFGHHSVLVGFLHYQHATGVTWEVDAVRPPRLATPVDVGEHHLAVYVHLLLRHEPPIFGSALAMRRALHVVVIAPLPRSFGHAVERGTRLRQNVVSHRFLSWWLAAVSTSWAVGSVVIGPPRRVLGFGGTGG